MTKTLSLEGSVIHVRNYGESDRIVELMTLSHGRVSLFARGARKSRRRFSGALDLFVHLRVQARPRAGIWGLDAADIVDVRLGIRKSLDTIRLASLMCNCVRELTAEDQDSPDFYELMKYGLDALARGDHLVAAHVLPGFIRAAGLLPDLERCTGCGGAFSGGAYADSQTGQCLCAACRTTGRRLQPSVLAVLQGERCPDADVAQGVERFVVSWIEAQTGRLLRSSRNDFGTSANRTRRTHAAQIEARGLESASGIGVAFRHDLRRFVCCFDCRRCLAGSSGNNCGCGPT